MIFPAVAPGKMKFEVSKRVGEKEPAKAKR